MKEHLHKLCSITSFFLILVRHTKSTFFTWISWNWYTCTLLLLLPTTELAANDFTTQHSHVSLILVQTTSYRYTLNIKTQVTSPSLATAAQPTLVYEYFAMMHIHYTSSRTGVMSKDGPHKNCLSISYVALSVLNLENKTNDKQTNKQTKRQLKRRRCYLL